MLKISNYLIFIITSACLAFVIFTIIIFDSKTETLDSEELYIPSNQYFKSANLSEGLWGFNAINYTDHVYKEIDKQKNKLSKITVAILDTGIDLKHPDLKDYIVNGYNFVNDTASIYDDNGHGTQIAGIIGGKHTGVAKGVKLMPVKVLNQEGFGKTEDFVEGILWAVDNGADIINISIGRQQDPFHLGDVGNSFEKLEYQAIEYALLNNVIVVCAAGDFNKDSLSYPAAYNYSHELDDGFIVASGIDSKKEKALMSNFSMDIDVTAPGEFILTTQPLELDKDDNDYVNTPDDGYILTNGTSYATAYVSGLAAAIKSYNPKSNVKEKIVQNTQDIGNTGKDELFGYGLIDFHKTIINVR